MRGPMRPAAVAGAIIVVVSGCGTIYSGAAVTSTSGWPGASWLERAEPAQPGPASPLPALESPSVPHARTAPIPEKRRWQRRIEEEVETIKCALRLPKAEKAGLLPQSAVWRCEVDYRCYDTDDDTGERLSLLRSGTAWYEEPSEHPQGSPGDMHAQSTACFEAHNHFAGGKTCNTGYPDFYELELEPEIGCRCARR